MRALVLLLSVIGCVSYHGETADRLDGDAYVSIYESEVLLPAGHRRLGDLKIIVPLWASDATAIAKAKAAARKRGANALVVVERPGFAYENRRWRFVLAQIP